MNFKFDEFFPIINIINSHGRQEEAKKTRERAKEATDDTMRWNVGAVPDR